MAASLMSNPVFLLFLTFKRKQLKAQRENNNLRSLFAFAIISLLYLNACHRYQNGCLWITIIFKRYAYVHAVSHAGVFLSFTFQRGSGALPGSSLPSAPGCWGRWESSQGAWRCSCHDDVWQHLVHAANGSEHDGREPFVRCRWPPGFGHSAGPLQPERGGRRDWMRTSQPVGSYWMRVCVTGMQMFRRVKERKNAWEW